MMRGVQGYKEMEIVDINPPIALATFDSPMQAMTFIRGQKRNPTVQTNKLWVSENRSRMERMRCKAVSKLNKFSHRTWWPSARQHHRELQEIFHHGSHQWQTHCVGICRR